MSKISNDSLKIVDLQTLQALNNLSIRSGYNRNLEWQVYKDHLKNVMDHDANVSWAGMKTRVLLEPVMIHKHKAGEECEPHVRCLVQSVGTYVLLDLPYESYEALNDVEPNLHNLMTSAVTQ